MSEALQEIPLAVFTTLAPIGAGAFIALALAFANSVIDEAKLKVLDKLTFVPLLFAFVGLVASFAHLTQPLNAFNVAYTLFESPMAIEIMAFGIFMVAAVVYWIWALTGKMKYSVRKSFGAVLAVLAAIFACAVGQAYLLDTVPTWNNPFTIISLLGFLQFGGVVLGLLVMQLAGCAEQALSGKGEEWQFAFLVSGFLFSLVGVIGLFVMGATAQSAVVDVAANTGTLVWAFVLFIVLSVIVFALGSFCVKLMPSSAVLVAAVVVVAIAVFLARLVFYGMQIGIGL